MNNAQSYAFALLFSVLFGIDALAQCSLHGGAEVLFSSADKIIEGKVTEQESFIDAKGNISTTNHIEVYRSFKGEVGSVADVVTEGGVLGDMMQIVTPSAQLHVGDYGVIALERSNLARTFIPIQRATQKVFGFAGIDKREELYDVIGHAIGTHIIVLKRIDLDVVEPATAMAADIAIDAIYPLEITAGTRSVLTITGSGFGETQGMGCVCFKNADDGGQSLVSAEDGPHFLSWTDTEIQLYVPSATLYNNIVAGSGAVRVSNTDGSSAESKQSLSINYAKSEVIYSESLDQTMLVGVQNGGYAFRMNQQLLNLLGSSVLVGQSLATWACNTGVNFYLEDQVEGTTDWTHDGVNLIGLSEHGQLPNYLLGRTVTTFSGCGTPNGIQWNLVEVDILLNRDIDWWVSLEPPMANRFDLETALLHELGHAHLLQHNNDASSPMYFQLTQGTARRELQEQSSIAGGSFVTQTSIEADNTCGEQTHVPFDFGSCNVSLLSGVEENTALELAAFPNPFQDQLTVQTNETGAQFMLTDVSGRVLIANSTTGLLTHIDTRSLPGGIYLLSVYSENSSTVSKLIKN